MEKRKIVVIAGNPAVTINEKEQIEITDYQIMAFEEAMKIVALKREEIKQVYVLFDHRSRDENTGMNVDFRDLFCDKLKMKDLSKRGRKGSIMLSYLPDDITVEYRRIAKVYDVDFGDIKLMSEGHLRADMIKEIRKDEDGKFETEVTRSCGELECEVIKNVVNCKGITAAAVRRAYGKDRNDVLFMGEFDDVRFKPEIINAGCELAKVYLGVKSKIKTVFLFSDGEKIEKIFNE
jgi:hypothetical protein